MKVGLAGFGNVGRDLAKRLLANVIPEMKLVAVSARDLEKAASFARTLSPSLPVVPLRKLSEICDVVVECATADGFAEIARAVLGAGKMLICVSAGGVPSCPDLVDLARKNGGKVRIASGAMPGLDIIRSAAEGTIRKVHLTSRIKPSSMAHERFVIDQGHDFESRPPSEPIKIFEGTGAMAAAHFPRHFNVAISLSLAGIGFERTTVEIWVDSAIPGAIHQVDLEADEINLTMTSRNFPSENPRTSRIVAPSILAALRSIVFPVVAGS